MNIDLVKEVMFSDQSIAPRYGLHRGTYPISSRVFSESKLTSFGFADQRGTQIELYKAVPPSA
jgi:hypothetical protein